MCTASGRQDSMLENPEDVELEDLPGSADRAVTPPSQSSPELPSGSQRVGDSETRSVPIITDVPATSEASMRLAQTASYFSHHFSEFVEEAVVCDLRSNALDSAGQSHGGNFSRCRFTQVSAQVDQGTMPFPPISSSSILASSNSSMMSSMCRESVGSIVSLSGSAMMEIGHDILNASSTIWQGYFPFFGFRFAWRMAFSFMRHCQSRVSQTHAGVRRFVTRIQTSLRGSVDDIGWLQRMPGLDPVEDRTDRFVQLLGLVSNGVHKLPNSFVYLLVPGLFSNHGPLYFVDTKKYLSKLGLTCHIAKIHSEAAVETNAFELKNYIEELYWGCGKRVMLLGHSKGGVDAAAAIAMFWPDLKEKVAGLVSVQSPYGGSAIASDILREGQIADLEARSIMELLICKIIKGDIRSLEDLTYDKRREFLAKHPLPSHFPAVSFHTEVSIAPGVISTMSHIAHAELPWLPLSGPGADFKEPAAATKLPVIVPLAAAMAICALHLDIRYGEKSDGVVVRKDAEIPGSVVVRPDRKFDHAWMVYSPARKEVKECDSSQMCEALLTLLLEVSQKRSRVCSCKMNVVHEGKSNTHEDSGRLIQGST